LLLRQHCSASERRMNKSEYASVIMVLLRRINEFTATQKNTHGHEQLGLLALRAGGHVQTPPTFPDSIEPLISVFENTVGSMQFGYGCRGGGALVCLARCLDRRTRTKFWLLEALAPRHCCVCLCM
jgi:hypothetical protein